MNLKNPYDIVSLPDGAVSVIKDGRETAVSIDATWVIQAAKAIGQNGTVRVFRTKADIIEEAINGSHWGLGQRGYTARATKCDVRSRRW